jgi:general stress protein 26
MTRRALTPIAVGWRSLPLALLLVVLWPVRCEAAELPVPTREALQSSDQIYVATRRRSGEPSSAKPVWFYYLGDDELFFTTSPGSWKAKRIARGSPLYIWVGGKDGPFLIGEAEEVSDAALIDRMGQAYAEKYWIAWLGFFKPRSSRVTEGKTKAYVVKVRPGEPPGD